MDKIRTIREWLANELDLHFSTLKEYTKVQFNLSIFSKVIVLTNYKSTDTQTDTQADTHSRKPFFSGSEGLKPWTFDKNVKINNFKFQHLKFHVLKSYLL